MDVFFIPLLKLLYTVIDLYIWAVIIGSILSLLISFQVVNPYNALVGMVARFLDQITEPFLSRIRNFLPIMNGIDLSSLVLVLFLYFIQNCLQQLMIKALM